jgi:signal transduction histidine kinase
LKNLLPNEILFINCFQKKAMIEAAPQRKIVLYVDDEPNNLSSFKAVFRRHYEIHVATSGDEGLEILQKIPVQLVITDQRMPKMTGVEFLEKINEQFPDVTRILLTGYSDLDAIIDAINKGKIFKYIAKPWKAEELKETIDIALEMANLKKQNKALVENLKKTNRELDLFVYRAAHDLRGPIANLLGLINLTKAEENLEMIRQYTHLKEQTIKRLDGFIHDIVNYSTNIRLAIKREKIDFQKIVAEAMQNIRFLPKFESLEKIIEIQQEGEFVSDRERLITILENLLKNAVRYSVLERAEKPFVKVVIQSNSEKATIQVIDNGEGIDTKYHEKIFEMFFRGSPNAREGSGLGLFIAKEIAEKLGGSIQVSSQKDIGSTFTIEIPNFLHIREEYKDIEFDDETKT